MEKGVGGGGREKEKQGERVIELCCYVTFLLTSPACAVLSEHGDFPGSLF